MADRLPSLFDFDLVAAAYDRWYETAEGQAHDSAQKATVLTLLPRPQAGERLLELGCGTGHWSRFFAEQGYEVFGLDVSPQMLAVARSRHSPQIMTVQARWTCQQCWGARWRAP